MARVFVCDRCKKPETPLEDGRPPWKAKHTKTISFADFSEDSYSEQIELCGGCWESFGSWLKLKTP